MSLHTSPQTQPVDGASLAPKTPQYLSNIELSMPSVTKFCHRWAVKELALFGSVLREDFRPDSDVDVIVDLDKSAKRHTLLDLAEMQSELEAMFSRKVDVLTKRSLERSHNPSRRDHILNSRIVLYTTADDLKKRD